MNKHTKISLPIAGNSARIGRCPRIWLNKAVCTVLILAILLSGVQFIQVQAAEAQIVMRCGIKPITSTNPLIADEASWKVLNLIYEGATKNSPATGERVPYIAVGTANESENTYGITWNDCVVGNFGYCPKTAWEDSTKPEIIIFYDFEGVLWHDDVQMNIRDIMFTFEAYAGIQYSWLGHPLKNLAGNLNSNYSQEHWLFIQNIWESEDGSRAALKFTLQEPLFSVFDYYLSMPILPYHIWGNREAYQVVNNTQIWCDPGYNVTGDYSWKVFFAERWPNPWPIGSGPFKWVGTDNDQISLVPWEGHFYKPGFKYYSYQAKIFTQPQIDILSLKFYSSEEQAVMDLESNKLDYIAWDISQSFINRFANDPDIRMQSLKSVSTTFMEYNMRRKSFGYARVIEGQPAFGMDYGKPLRRALIHCINTPVINAMSNQLAVNIDSLAIYNVWENTSAPKYAFDPPESILILRNANYILDNPDMPPGNGNWWQNPDGSQIGSAVGGKIELLITESDYDPVRFKIGTLIVNQMREIGINAELVPLDLDSLKYRIFQRDFDIYIGSEDLSAIYLERPENFIFSTFHTDNAYDGPNYCGYQNATFDRIIEAAMRATDLEHRRTLVRDGLATLAIDIPRNSLYSLSKIEIYRYDNFYGLIDDGSGTLLNTRSIANVRIQEKNALHAQILGLPITTQSNSTSKVLIRVTDQNGNIVIGAEMKLETSAGYLLNTTGITDQNGQFTTNYTAPYVPLVETYNNWEAVKIRMVTATMEDYRDAPAVEFTITVFPVRMRTMFVEASVNPNVISGRDNSGNPGIAYIQLHVKDMSNLPMDRVRLRIQTSDPTLSLSASTIETDSGGSATIKIYAPDVNQTLECRITINATKVGFFNASQEIALVILPPQPEPVEAPVPLINRIAIPLAFGLILSALIGAAYFVRRRRR